MLLENTDIDKEILRTEQIMLINGIVPSCFFRFPGLVSDEALFEKVLNYGLIPLGTNAWIANRTVPQNGDIILLHANGNEPAGFTALKKMHRQGKISFGITDIYSLLRTKQ